MESKSTSSDEARGKIACRRLCPGLRRGSVLEFGRRAWPSGGALPAFGPRVRPLCLPQLDWTTTRPGARMFNRDGESLRGGLLAPSHPAEHPAAREDQAGKTCADDGAGNSHRPVIKRTVDLP